MNGKKIKASKTKVSKAKPVTLRQLKSYRGYLEALANVQNDQDLAEIMTRMKNSDFKMICTCVNHFLYDEGPMADYLNHKEANRLKHILHPWKKHLKLFSDPNTNINQKKALLQRKQRGGNGDANNGDAILASVIGGLMPMIVDSVLAAPAAALA